MALTTFGFSAFLKMLSLGVRPQRTAMRNRLRPSAGGGYDFHRQFRLLAHRYLAGGEPLDRLVEETESFGNVSEGRAARQALEYLQGWRANNPGAVFDFPPRVWQSATGTFAVRYTPDFGLEIDGDRVAVHIWKTQRPLLDARMTYAALALFEDSYDDDPEGPSDLAVLSVVDGRLYRLSDVPSQAVLSARVAGAIESLIEEIGEETPRPPQSEIDRTELPR